MIPLDDAVLLWIIENRRTIQQTCIRIRLNKTANPPKTVHIEDPYLSVYMTVLIEKKMI